MRKKSLLTVFVMSVLGCSGGDDPDDKPPVVTGDFDQALLAQYRAVIPASDDLQASVPEASAMGTHRPEAIGDAALYPAASRDVIIGVNGTVAAMVTLLQAFVMVPPTFYDSAAKEFFWGPFANKNGVGWVGMYIRDAGTAEDFRYHFAFVRGASNDVATMVPVIWGGANPDAEDRTRGSSVMLWDFEANHAFDMEHDPDFATKAHDRGRFVVVSAKGPADEDPEGEQTIVLSSFRNFVSRDEPDDAPSDLDYFWGHVEGADLDISFLDLEYKQDVSAEDSETELEDLNLRLAFTDGFVGRAEGKATGGELGTESIDITECWDSAGNRTFFRTLQAGDEVSEGTEMGCAPLFQQSLADLGIPTLGDVDPELRQTLDQLATNGFQP